MTVLYPNLCYNDVCSEIFLSEIRVRGLLNLGKKHMDRLSWENLMQYERTGLSF